VVAVAAMAVAVTAGVAALSCSQLVSTGSSPVTGHRLGSSEGEDIKDEGKCRANRGSAPFSIPTTRLSGRPELGKVQDEELYEKRV
jgi:hypothetical protein